ncbi:MAG: S41 family peptidase [Fimbriimonas sp.]
MGISILLAALLTSGGSNGVVQAEGPLLVRTPTVGPTTVVFAFAGDLWSVPRAGGSATRLTSSPTAESGPVFSPDGKQIAFTSQIDGNPEVYVMPAEGGVAKRLTYYPGPDQATSWTPDSKRVIFRSGMQSYQAVPQLFSVGLNADFPQRLLFPIANNASMGPDGKQIAFVPSAKWQTAWKRYRGGNASKIWIGNLSDSKVTEIPGRGKAEDSNPMWVNDSIYFLSDRTAGKMGIWKYDTASKQTQEIIPGQGLDIRSAGAGFGAIAYEKLGSLRLYDLATKQDREIPITIRGDFPQARTQFKPTGVSSVSISPSGVRLVVEARGHILSVPIKQGDPRDLTPAQGVANRTPAWSPDGKTIAYFSDKGGEYNLVLQDASGTGSEGVIKPGKAPAFYYGPTWSPDSKKICYWDNRHILWVLDVASGVSEQVDEATYEDPTRDGTPSWSPDSKWIAWHRDLATQFSAIFVYNVETKQKSQITDGLSDAKYPSFDLGGEYLFFAASTDTAGGTAWLDLSALDNMNRTSRLYCAVLKNDGPDPLAAETDEEPDPDAKPEPPKTTPFRIDLDGIERRVVSLPAAGNVVSLNAGPTGSVFMVLAPFVGKTPSPAPLVMTKFDLATQATAVFARNVNGFTFTPKRDKVLIVANGELVLVPTAAPPAPGQGVIRSATIPVRIDPVAEWAQIFREAVRLQRDFFYDPGHHGQDLDVLEKRYRLFLAGLKSRADLNYLFDDMMGEISVGHMYIGGGDIPAAAGVGGGFLGADFALENGRYRIKRIFDGESWNPGPRPPLAGPGINVKVGDYVLAVDGTDLTDQVNLYAAMEGKADRVVKVKVGPTPDGKDSRVIVVKALASEDSLRRLAWTEDNRRMVAKLSDGKLGYVHVPDTGGGGWTNFNRYFFSQRDREGFVIDERFNGGGSVDDYMVDQLSRPLMSMWTSRYGRDFASPAAGHFGPKVLLINEFAGSGGDYFPWAFRKKGIGPIIGNRTWGGLVGILIFPEFVDGGSMTSPNIAFYNPDGRWEIENEGVSPDYPIDLDPALWRLGRDTQLEKAVEVALARLKDWKKPEIKKPAYPNKSKIGG